MGFCNATEVVIQIGLKARLEHGQKFNYVLNRNNLLAGLVWESDGAIQAFRVQ